MDVAGLYQLESVNGGQLPHRTFVDEDGDHEELLEASLSLHSDGAMVHQSRFRQHIFGGELVREREEILRGTYTYTTTEVRLHAVQPDTVEAILVRRGDRLFHSDDLHSVYVRRSVEQ